MKRRRYVAVFEGEAALLRAVADCKGLGVEVLDVHSPAPIHGIDELLGIRRSRLTIVCFLGGLVGLTLGLAAQYWTSASDWPLNVAGKPFDSLPAFIPVAFELTVLFAGLSTALALCVRSRLWPGRRPPLSIEGVTDDRYALLFADPGPRLPAGELERLLARHGALGPPLEVRT